MTDTARMQWARETGLPPELFEASKEELAFRYVQAWARKLAADRERISIESIPVHPIELKDDAMAFVRKQSRREEDLMTNLLRAWENKR